MFGSGPNQLFIKISVPTGLAVTGGCRQPGPAGRVGLVGSRQPLDVETDFPFNGFCNRGEVKIYWDVNHLKTHKDSLGGFLGWALAAWGSHCVQKSFFVDFDLG